MTELSSVLVEFPDNRLAAALFGGHDAHLKLIEERLRVTIHPRGNAVLITAVPLQAQQARQLLEGLYRLLEQGHEVALPQVEDGIRAAEQQLAVGELYADSSEVRTPRRLVRPRTATQVGYIASLRKAQLTLVIGPAGTGKTYLAVAVAVSCLIQGEVSRIVLTRPAVEAGERLGFLPGDLHAKVDPYLRPLYDALHDMLGVEKVEKMLAQGVLEIAPLAYMRGRTLTNGFIIMDEAQNTTPEQMKMFLTRLGEGSRMVAAGDVTQLDLPRGQVSGMVNAWEVLQPVKEINFVRFHDRDVVRHSLVQRIVQAYDAAGRGGNGGQG